MEHIIQFGVTIDEQKIIDHTTEKASAEIISTIRREINDYTRGWQDSRLSQLFKAEIKKVVDEHKEQIITEAIKNVSVNITKTKAVKELIAKLEEGVI